MKKTVTPIVILILMLILFVSKSNGQHHDINKLDNEIELTLDSAAKHMINFILTQKESEYNTAIDRANKAEELNKVLITKAADEKGVAGKIENSIIEDRKEEIESYKDESIKNLILSEKSNQRKVKVKYHGQTYTLSEKSKKLFDGFYSYLPRN